MVWIPSYEMKFYGYFDVFGGIWHENVAISMFFGGAERGRLKFVWQKSPLFVPYNNKEGHFDFGPP